MDGVADKGGEVNTATPRQSDCCAVLNRENCFRLICMLENIELLTQSNGNGFLMFRKWYVKNALKLNI